MAGPASTDTRNLQFLYQDLAICINADFAGNADGLRGNLAGGKFCVFQESARGCQRIGSPGADCQESVIGLDDVRQDIAMLRVPDGHGRVELARFHRPKAGVRRRH